MLDFNEHRAPRVTVGKFALGVLGMAAATICTAGWAQRPATAASRSPLSLDVAGVRLAMPIAQARAALRPTYRCEAMGGELTFRQRVDDEVRKRRTGSSGRWGGGLGTSSDKCQGPGGEDLTIDYAELRGGAIVQGFRLSMPKDRFVAAEIRRGLLAKFGRPTLPNPEGGRWCDPGYRCDASSGFIEGPRVQVYDNAFATVVDGERGEPARAADRAAVLAEVDRIAPKRSGAAF